MAAERAARPPPTAASITDCEITMSYIRFLKQQCYIDGRWCTVKKVSMELGGNAPFIVFDDAHVDAAVEGAIISKFRNGGQTCVCANRFYVQEGVYEEFVLKLEARVKAMPVGYRMDSGTIIGPLIDMAAAEKVEEHQEDALSGGATMLAGGKRASLGGCYFEPTVVANVSPGMKLTREETFGPLAGVIRFKDDAEAIMLANDTEYGLASYFYATNLSRVWRVAEALEAGIVGINTGLISTEVAPFGGVKMSGMGREGSRHRLDDYMEIKIPLHGRLTQKQNLRMRPWQSTSSLYSPIRSKVEKTNLMTGTRTFTCQTF
jgi:succinate-semialdehyde dehydrogenase/glutarate-semialdehyde dehydrogenase